MAIHAKVFLAVSFLLNFLSTQVFSTSTFNISPSDGAATTISFALSIPENTNDLVFNFTAPSTNSWVGIGTGEVMAGSLMFIMYSSKDGKNVTLSPRLAPSHNEPQYSPDIQTTILEGTGIINNMLTVNARCQNCTTWPGGSLDVTSTSAPWLYGIGPSYTMREDSLSATIQQHQQHGVFNFDMKQATSSSSTTGSPSSPSASSGATLTGAPKSDIAWVPILHGIVTAGSFVLLMPIGVLFLRLFEKVRWHWLNQLLASILGIAGIVGGIYVSTTYNKAKSFNQAHQIIGLIVLASVFVQVFLGWWHHRTYKRTKASTPFSPVHRFLGLGIILLAAVNGALGLDLADNNKYQPAYIVVAAVLLVITAGLLGWKRWSVGRKKKYSALREQRAGEEFGPGIQLGERYPR